MTSSPSDGLPADHDTADHEIGGAPRGIERWARRAARLVRRTPDPAQAYRVEWEPLDQPAPSWPSVRSQACTAAQIATPEYERWCRELGMEVLAHRKQWEWCYALQALEEAGMLAPGNRGLGFGVGSEPLTAMIVKHGCEVVATDLGSEADTAQAWIDSGQHAASLADLNAGGLCPTDEFAARVAFRSVDMNAIPADLTGFDFTWSSCALEHLGDLDAGMRFFERQLECLRPGGVGVHTTEYNVGSNDATVVRGSTVVYRRRDLEALVRRVTDAGHEMSITFGLGDQPDDRHVDTPPWGQPHLKIATYGFVLTSFGLIVRKAA